MQMQDESYPSDLLEHPIFVTFCKGKCPQEPQNTQSASEAAK